MMLLGSCVTVKKTTYLQDLKKSDIPAGVVTPESYRIQPNDNLFIRVTTPNPEWSAMFNTVTAGSTTIGHSEQSVDLLSYSVSREGTVEIPYLGEIGVGGKTLREARELLEVALNEYVSDAAITVKLVNSFISVLGEVNNPGRYPIYKEQMNIFQALAMAGDMAQYSNRYELSLIRQTPGGSEIRTFDLTDRNIVDSEYYYVMPNDVLYAKSIKGKFFGLYQFPYTVLLTSVTTAILVLNFINLSR
jgi:polysaccharide biosynthesis/export protein